MFSTYMFANICFFESNFVNNCHNDVPGDVQYLSPEVARKVYGNKQEKGSIEGYQPSLGAILIAYNPPV